MSNFNLWYGFGIVILSASFCYLAFAAMQFMQTDKKRSKTSTSESNATPPTQFLRHALVAFVGMLLGTQMLQYSQNQNDLVKQDIGRDAALARALGPRPSVSDKTAVGSSGGSPRLGARPTSRPPRGSLSSVADISKASAPVGLPAVTQSMQAPAVATDAALVLPITAVSSMPTSAQATSTTMENN